MPLRRPLLTGRWTQLLTGQWTQRPRGMGNREKTMGGGQGGVSGKVVWGERTRAEALRPEPSPRPPPAERRAPRPRDVGKRRRT